MMQMIGGLGFNPQQEVTLEVRSDSLVDIGSGSVNIELTVITEEGDPVPNAQVLITSGTLTVNDNPIPMGSATGPAATGENGQISHSLSPSDVDFRSDQDKGTIQFDIVTQGDGNYKDEKDNPEIVLTE